MAVAITRPQLETIAEIYGGPGNEHPILIARAGRDVPAASVGDMIPGTVYVTSDVLQIRVYPDGEHEVTKEGWTE